MRPAGSPSITISKKTSGLGLLGSGVGVGVGVLGKGLQENRNEKPSNQDDEMVSQPTKENINQAPQTFILPYTT